MTITLSKTADGSQEYLQILSADMAVNVVLIAPSFVLQDFRAGVPRRKRKEKTDAGKTE